MLQLKSRNDTFTVEILSNGYIFDYGGRDMSDDWVSDRHYFASLDEMMDVVADFVELPKA